MHQAALQDQMELSSADRAVMGGSRQLRNCSRMAVIGHIVAAFIAGMVIGYSFSAADVDRAKLVADVEQSVARVSDMKHFVNETNRVWRAVEMEAVEMGLNEVETGCVEHGLEGVNMSQSAFLENRALPFNRTDFAGVVQSFVPAVDFQVRLNPGTAFTFSDASQTTFWNTKTRNNHLNMLFEDRAPHKLYKKRLCYFAFQREKRAAPSPTNK